MVRNKILPTPAKGSPTGAANGPSGRAFTTSRNSPSKRKRAFDVEQQQQQQPNPKHAGGGKNSGSTGPQSAKENKRPPKPKVQLDLIDPPANAGLAKLLEFALGPNYLAGHVRRMPDGTIAKPRLVITPKASQHPAGSLVAGQFVSLLLIVWTLAGLWLELMGDERLLLQLGDPAKVVENVEYNSRLVNSSEMLDDNHTGLYLTGWVNASATGSNAPIVYANFTCMRPVRCGTAEAAAMGFQTTECTATLDSSAVFFDSTDFLAEKGVVFVNRSSAANTTEHVFPWYPSYQQIHDGYNWAKIRRTINTTVKPGDSIPTRWEPEVDEWGDPINPEDQFFTCSSLDDVGSRDGSLGLMADLQAFLGNRTLNEFLGIPEGEFDVEIQEFHYTFRYYFAAANQCAQDNDDDVACLNHTAHPPYICGYSFSCYAVELPDEEYELYANTYCNALKPVSCLLESTLFLCELRQTPYTPPESYNPNLPIGIFVDLNATVNTSGSTPLQYAALRAGNYTQVWETPFSNLHYWEAGSWAKGASPHILRRTGADIYDAISNQTANETQQMKPSPEGPFSDCLAVPSTAIKLTWCYTNDDTLMAGLDRGDGEYLSDIQDAYETSVTFDSGAEGFTSDCYEADWFESMNDRGWSTCDPNYYLTGLHIGEDNTYLFFLEAGRCCRVGVVSEFVVQHSVDLECVAVDWDGVTNGTCPHGTFLQGFYREAGSQDDADRLWRLTKARCCSTAVPATCSDGRMNGIEDGVDCGGDCDFECGELCFGDFTTGTGTTGAARYLQDATTVSLPAAPTIVIEGAAAIASDARHIDVKPDTDTHVDAAYQLAPKTSQFDLHEHEPRLLEGGTTPMPQQSTGPVVPAVAFLEWKDGSDIQCPASACQNSFFTAGATQVEEEVECCLQICAERGFYVTQESQFDYIFDIEPIVVRPSQYCDCLKALVGRGTFLSSSIRGSFEGEMVPGDGETRWTLYREEGGSSLALQFDLGAPDRICTGVFLVKAGEVLGVDETAFLESPLFLASQYNMWHISSDASTILWTDFYNDVHMTFDNTVYNLEECMVPAAVFKHEYMTLRALSSFSWALWVFLLVVGILWLAYFIFVTAAHRLLLHDQYRGSVVLWGAWDIIMWLQIVVQACKSMVYIDLLNKGAPFDLWYPNLNGLQVDLAWMIRGFEQNSFERGYQQTESTPSAPNAFKAGVWGQIFLVGFNIARYVGLDWARKLAPPGARFLDRVSGLVVGCVCGMALLLQPALQLALYSVAMRFQLARTSRFPLTAVDVAPEVFLTGVSVILSVVLVLNTVRIGVAGYFPLFPLSQRKDRRQGFRNFRTGMFGVMGGCDQNFSDTTGKFVFFRLLNPIGLGPFASLAGIAVLAAPCALKAHILSVAGTESLFCAWDGALIDAAIGVCVLFLIGMVVIQFMCFSACRN